MGFESSVDLENVNRVETFRVSMNPFVRNPTASGESSKVFLKQSENHETASETLKISNSRYYSPGFPKVKKNSYEYFHD